MRLLCTGKALRQPEKVHYSGINDCAWFHCERKRGGAFHQFCLSWSGKSYVQNAGQTTLDRIAVIAHIKKAGVTVIGSGLDEAPMAYKDIRQVMACQKNLVEVLGEFSPKIVRMCGDRKFHEAN